MPLIEFDALPDEARVWVFAASDDLTPDRAGVLIGAVDAYLAGWRAHGEPLTSARDWRDGRFLAVGVDQSTAGASGCSIDALFRILHGLQPSLGTTLLGGGRVFYRDRAGQVRVTERAELARLTAAGELGEETPVFDTAVTTAGEYRRRFERPLRESRYRATAPSRAP
jgi:hypothetical protein